MIIVKKIVTKCPRVQSFWITKKEKNGDKTWEQPLIFEATYTRPSKKYVSLRALQFARHLTSISVMVDSDCTPAEMAYLARLPVKTWTPGGMQSFRPLRATFPTLQELNVWIAIGHARLSSHVDMFVNFAKQVKNLWQHVPKVKVTIEIELWTLEQIRVVRTWNNVGILEVATSGAYLGTSFINRNIFAVPAYLPKGLEQVVFRMKRVAPEWVLTYIEWENFNARLVETVESKRTDFELDTDGSETQEMGDHIEHVISFRVKTQTN